ETSLARFFGNLLRQNEVGMANLGVFGEMVVEELGRARRKEGERKAEGTKGAAPPPAAPAAGPAAFGGRGGALARDGAALMDANGKDKKPAAGEAPPAPGVEPTVRRNFADTAFW